MKAFSYFLTFGSGVYADHKNSFHEEITQLYKLQLASVRCGLYPVSNGLQSKRRIVLYSYYDLYVLPGQWFVSHITVSSVYWSRPTADWRQWKDLQRRPPACLIHSSWLSLIAKKWRSMHTQLTFVTYCVAPWASETPLILSKRTCYPTPHDPKDTDKISQVR